MDELMFSMNSSFSSTYGRLLLCELPPGNVALLELGPADRLPGPFDREERAASLRCRALIVPFKDAIWACCLAEADILGVFVDDICTGYHVVFMRLFISFPHSKNGLSVQSVGFLFST